MHGIEISMNLFKIILHNIGVVIVGLGIASRGDGRSARSQGRIGLIQIVVWLYRALGAAVAIGAMELLAHVAQEPLSRVPFVTSIVLTMSLPDSEPAQPYAVIVGHLASCVAGFAAVWCLGSGEMASAVGVGLAALLMLTLRAMHPPAGIDAFLVAGWGLPASWTLSPVLVGAVLLASFARLWSVGERRLAR
jgi:CBS-domain-containing membrane protein